MVVQKVSFFFLKAGCTEKLLNALPIYVFFRFFSQNKKSKPQLIKAKKKIMEVL